MQFCLCNLPIYADTYLSYQQIRSLLGTHKRFFSDLRALTTYKDDLYYTFDGQKIPLALRQDTVAVAFKPVNLRGKALFQQLQEDLQKKGNS